MKFKFSEHNKQKATVYNYSGFLLEGRINHLAGIVLIVDEKVLLVQPRKFKKYDDMWSIPKGHVKKKQKKLDAALKEFYEETGIILNKEQIEQKIVSSSNIFYKKSGVIKELKYFVIKMTIDDIKPYLKRKTSQVKKSYFKSKEIFNIKFFTKIEAESIIEKGQFSILRELL